MAKDFELIYKNNIIFLEKHWPELYEKVIEADISCYELFEYNDNVNVKVNGHTLYPEEVNEAINTQVSTYLNKPSSFYQAPCINQKSTWNEVEFIHDTYVVGIEEISPYRNTKNSKFEGYSHNNDEHSYPYFLLIGIGAGQHLEQLISKSDVKNIVIVDEDYSFLKVSMHIIDWEPIFRFFNKDGHSITFKTSKKPRVLAYSVINELFAKYPHFISFIPYYIHYESDFLLEFKKIYEEKIQLALSGLGYYDDEMTSLEHTLVNLHNSENIPFYKGNTKLPEDSTVFIIGSGPSLDQDIEYIKKHKDQVIIISCGTALKVLASNDIMPDYQIEIERPSNKRDLLLAFNVEQKYFDEVTLLGLNSLHSGGIDLFKNKLLFCRGNDAGSTILDNIPNLDHCNPTVVNAGLSLATEFGFNNIYTFGTDVGFWDGGYHHSKDSAYYDKEGKLYSPVRDTETTRRIKSNFHEENIKTTELFYWCKQRMENCIKKNENKKINYFNCSDGAYIEGTTPLRSKDIPLRLRKKSTVVKSIFKSFITDKKEFNKFKKKSDKLFNREKNIYMKNINNIIKFIEKAEIKTYSEMFDLMQKIYNLITNSIENDKSGSFTFAFLRGTFYHFFASIYTHSLATINKEESFKFINDSFKMIVEFLNIAKNDIIKFKY